jgi:lysozyme
MKTSSIGLNMIRRNEGCELTAYLDQIANPPVWTIGYGDTKNVHSGMEITKQEAEERLVTRLANEFEPAVMEAIGHAPVTQAQFDAMVSLAWNIGGGKFDNPDTPKNEGNGFRNSSVARHHKAGDYASAADAFRSWNRAGGKVIKGLVRRREEERALYLSALPAEPQSPPPEKLVKALASLARAAKKAQRELTAFGFDTGPADGDWGPRSRATWLAYRKEYPT